MLATTCKANSIDWESYVRPVCYAYSTSVHTSTKYTPHYLMFSWEARLPVDLQFGLSFIDTVSPDQYTRQLQNGLSYAYRVTREMLGVAQDQLYNRMIHGKPFTAGDLVWLLSTVIPSESHRKLHHPWTRPYAVLEKLSDINYKIKPCSSAVDKILIVHFNRLKKCVSGTRLHPPPSPHTLSSTTNSEHIIGDGAILIDADDDVHIPALPGPPLVPPPQPAICSVLVVHPFIQGTSSLHNDWDSLFQEGMPCNEVIIIVTHCV